MYGLVWNEQDDTYSRTGDLFGIAKYTQGGNSACSSVLVSGGNIYMGMYDTYFVQKLKIRSGGVSADCPYRCNSYHTGYNGVALSGDFLPDNLKKWVFDGWNINQGKIWVNGSLGVSHIISSSDTTIAKELAVESRCKVSNFTLASDAGWLWQILWDIGYFTNNGYMGGLQSNKVNTTWSIFETSPPNINNLLNEAIVNDTWYRQALRITNTNQYLDINGTQKCTIACVPTSTINPVNAYMVANNDGSAFTSHIDFIFTRKYVNPEPEHSTWYAEEVMIGTLLGMSSSGLIFVRRRI